MAADTSNGSWWYSINDGTTWIALGSVAVNKARHLAADASTRIHFRPNANFYDTLDSTYCLTISTIQFHAWDQTRWTKRSMAMTNTPGKGFAVRRVSVL